MKATRALSIKHQMCFGNLHLLVGNIVSEHPSDPSQNRGYVTFFLYSTLIK